MRCGIAFRDCSPIAMSAQPTERDPLLSSESAESQNVSREFASSKRSMPWILFGLWSPVFLGALDATIVATLIAPIGSYFQQSHKSTYMGTSYLLSVCCFTPLYGRLSDIIGRKAAMLLALTLFTIGTLMCGLSTSLDMLIASQAIAGMGGGGIMTVSNIALTDLVPIRQRGLYQGLANVVFGAGAGLGGPLGGWINQVIGWRWAFLFQIPPLILAALIVTLRVDIPFSEEMRKQPTSEKIRRVDWLGSLTLVTGVGGLLLGLSLKASEDLAFKNILVWLPLAMSVFGLVSFVLVEAYWSVAPIMPIHLLKQRTTLAVAIGNFFVSITSFGMLYNVPLYFSVVQLKNSSETGAHLLPNALAGSIGSLFAGWFMRQTGKYYYLTLFSAFSSLTSCVLVFLWGESTTNFGFWFDIVPNAFGGGSLLTTTLIAMITSVSRDDMAVATGITYLFRTSGQVLAVALSGAIIQARLNVELPKRIFGPGSEELIRRIRRETGIIATLPLEHRQAAVDSYASSIKMAFLFQVCAAVLLFIASLFIRENPLPATVDPKLNNDDDD